jgi:branched-chain amino acid transport system ATP-binding protein
VRRPKTLLRVDGVSRRFGGLRALDDVTFDVIEGEILALIGPNGAGKSTMLNVISGFTSADAGSVTFDGERIDGLAAYEVNARGLVRTFQAAEILQSLTVRENVMAASVAKSGSGIVAGLFGRTKDIAASLRTKALAHLAVVGLEGLADVSAAQLTAGQQRLLAAARALATGARLLILDEPAAGLNTIEKNLLAEIVLRIRARGITLVFVEHDLGFVGRLAERMVVLDHGKVIASGTPDRVRADAAVIEAYLGDADVGSKSASTGRTTTTATAILRIESLSVRYASLVALDRIDVVVGVGEIVALIGANGAGKSTLLKAVAGGMSPYAGRIVFDGLDLASTRMEARPALGIALAPEGRALFPALTVRDNLLLGRYARVRRTGWLHVLRPHGGAARELDATLAEVLAFFPRLADRIDQQAGTLSGGEAQMLAIGRALMSSPRLLMLDEPSFGLAPRAAREILESLPRLAERGITVLMVEQNARAALQVADRAYILVNGSVVTAGPSSALLQDPAVSSAYLGWGGEAVEDPAGLPEGIAA